MIIWAQATANSKAIETGRARPLDFVWKIILTAITMRAGFRGGEIVPAFCVGATFGCVMGQLLGFPPVVAAAAGMVALFCGVTNCPININAYLIRVVWLCRGLILPDSNINQLCPVRILQPVQRPDNCILKIQGQIYK